MKLIPDWKKVLTKAASVRWMLVAMLFTGAEAALPFFTGYFDLDPRWFAGITFGIVAAAFASRLIAQKAFEDEDE